QRKVQLKGVDYIPEMIAEANERIKEIGNSLKGIAEFQVGDITKLKEKKEAFDKVVVIRVLINLRDWDRQVLGLKQCTELLKPGGKLLLSEATLQGWQKLNRFRLEWGLKEIPIPAFNQYLDQDKIVEAALPELELVEIVNFASSYFVATRVFKPLLAKAIASEIDISNPLMEFNRFFSYFPQVGDYGTQKLFVFKKK
ncbi:MAG: class I SAM-dependent methyltransferase, partial [Chlamydiae bacterium]|nr:class I SAM-dependent methyltransferase [Chlamydiota bacterium]